MNATAGVTLIAGWALTERVLVPLVKQLFPRSSADASVWAKEVVEDGVGNASSVARNVGLYLVERRRERRWLCRRRRAFRICGSTCIQTGAAKAPQLSGRLVDGGHRRPGNGDSLSRAGAAVGAHQLLAQFYPPSSDHHAVQSLAVRAMIVGLHRDRPETLRRFFAQVHSECGSEAQMAEDLHRALRLDPDHLVHGLRYLQTVDLRSRLSAVRVPTCIAHGRKDRVISWRASELLQAGIGGSDLLLFAEGDHGLVATSPEILAPAILRFLQRGPTSRMRDNTSTVLHFSRAAAVYHTRAELQRAVAGRLLQYLSGPVEAECILELGCGTGFLTSHLLELLARARIDALDISATMIEQARRTVAAAERIHWHVCDVWDYQAESVYDLISSSSSLQWMQPLDALFCRLAPMLKPAGRLLCSLMVEGTLGELHRLRGRSHHKKVRETGCRRSPRQSRVCKALDSGSLVPDRKPCKRSTRAPTTFCGPSSNSDSREGRWPPPRRC